jgi:hypothetical protein
VQLSAAGYWGEARGVLDPPSGPRPRQKFLGPSRGGVKCDAWTHYPACGVVGPPAWGSRFRRELARSPRFTARIQEQQSSEIFQNKLSNLCREALVLLVTSFGCRWLLPAGRCNRSSRLGYPTHTAETTDPDSPKSIGMATSRPTREPCSHAANSTATSPTFPASQVCVVKVPGTWAEMFALAQNSGQRIGLAHEIPRPRTCLAMWATLPRPGPRLGSPVTVDGNCVRRASAPTSTKGDSIVVHRPGLVPLPKDQREPAIAALSSLFENLVHRTASSSHELDLAPESRSHASDPCPEQGQLSSKQAEGACG